MSPGRSVLWISEGSKEGLLERNDDGVGKEAARSGKICTDLRDLLWPNEPLIRSRKVSVSWLSPVDIRQVDELVGVGKEAENMFRSYAQPQSREFLRFAGDFVAPEEVLMEHGKSSAANLG